MFLSDVAAIMNALYETKPSAALLSGLFSLLDWQKTCRIDPDDLLLLLTELALVNLDAEQGFDRLWDSLCLLEGRTGAFPRLAIHSFVRLQCNLLCSVLPGMPALLEKIRPAKIILSLFAALENALSQSTSDPTALKHFFGEWMGQGNCVVDTVLLSHSQPFLQQRALLQCALGLQQVKVSDMQAIVTENADSDYQLLSRRDLFQFWDRFFPLLSLALYSKERETILGDVFTVFSKRYTFPDGSDRLLVDLTTVATFACILLDSDVTAFVRFFMDLRCGNDASVPIQEMHDFFSFLATSTILIESCFSLSFMHRSGVPLIPATEFGPFFVTRIQDMTLDKILHFVFTDILHILLYSPSLFLPLTSQHYQFYPPIVKQSTYLHIHKVFYSCQVPIYSFYTDLCDAAQQSERGVVFKGNFYQAMREQYRGNETDKELLRAIDVLWSQALEDHEMADGCSPVDLLQNLAALFFMDAPLLEFYSSEYSEEKDCWSYNAVFEFFVLIYHIYDLVRFPCLLHE